LKLFKGNDKFFRKDEEGRDLFYPWGYPGEAFCTDLKQRKRIEKFFLAFSVLVIFAVFGTIFAHVEGIISLNILLYVGGVGHTFFPAFYILSMYSFRKDVSVLAIPKDRRVPKKIIKLLLILIISYQGASILTALKDELISPVISIGLVALNVVGALCISYVLIKIYKTKGYYFSG